jgi:hypothetical protein
MDLPFCNDWETSVSLLASAFYSFFLMNVTCYFVCMFPRKAEILIARKHKVSN